MAIIKATWSADARISATPLDMETGNFIGM
jgi:hypothetical protein